MEKGNLRNTLCEFLKFSRQSPRSRASTDFGSLLAKKRSHTLLGHGLFLFSGGGNTYRLSVYVTGSE